MFRRGINPYSVSDKATFVNVDKKLTLYVRADAGMLVNNLRKANEKLVKITDESSECEKVNAARFFARAVFGVSCSDEEDCAKQGIEEMAKFFAQIGMPSSLREFGIGKESIEGLSLLCTQNGTRLIKSYIPLGTKEISEIFESCY